MDLRKCHSKIPVATVGSGGGGDGWGRGRLVTGNSGFTGHELETCLAENHAAWSPGEISMGRTK